MKKKGFFFFLLIILIFCSKCVFAIRLNKNVIVEKDSEEYYRPVKDYEVKPGNMWVPYEATKRYDPTERFFIAKAFWHLHTVYGDGHTVFVKSRVKMARDKDYDVVFFSEHSDKMLKKENYNRYVEDVQKYNTDGELVVFPGREIVVGTTKSNFCHLNTFSFEKKPYMYSPDYSIDQLPEVLGILDAEGAFYVANHINTCPEWEDRLDLFHGMEFFNDFPGEKKMPYLKNLYIKHLNNGWRGFVVAGVDYHSYHENFFRTRNSTFILTKALDQQSIFDAIREGRTIATTDGIIVRELSLAPSLYKYVSKDKDLIEIKGKLVFSRSLPIDKSIYLVVPSEGSKGKKFLLKKSKDFSDEYSFSIHIDQTYNNKRFFLEVPGYLISSPYEVEIKTPTITQEEFSHEKKAFRITDAYFCNKNLLWITTENEAVTDLFKFYEVCEEGYLIRSKTGKIGGCFNPVLLVGVVDGTGTALIDKALCFVEFFSASREVCTSRIIGSYMIEIGEDDYRAVIPSNVFPSIADTIETLLITSNTNISNGSLFKVCDGNDFSLDNKTGKILDCSTSYRNVSINRKDGKMMPRLNLFNSGMYISLKNYFIVLKE
uniref:Polymerase/histidinol phosphatase N-terminal domain-containing protein n=1 Tax=candidate division CPR3 bacterium TaxID=2268181 RepID=A0A7C4R263_UNCC3